MTSKIGIWKLLIVAIILTGAFASGFVIRHFDIIPVSGIKTALGLQDYLESKRLPKSGERIVETNLTSLKLRRIAIVPGNRVWGGGGAIASFRDGLIGVTKDARVFAYMPETGVTPLDVRIDNNADELRGSKSTQGDTDPLALTYFRVLDILSLDKQDTVEIFISYNFWHSKADCKTVRVSRFVLSPDDESPADISRMVVADSAVIFESQPCITFGLDEWSPFKSVNSGGRLLLLDAESLLLTLGDHYMDGVNNPVIASQDMTVDYGKVILINLADQSSDYFAIGVRNPQGLAMDSEGNIWETEHGPKGGDELNQIKRNGNYGWPFATYGTQYDEYSWALNPQVGRHVEFDKPVFSWVPSIAVSAIIQVESFPETWAGDFLIGSLKSASLYRTRILDGRVILSEKISVGERVRDLVQLRDGTLVLLNDSYELIVLTFAGSDRGSKDLHLPVELSAREVELGLQEILTVCAACHGFSPDVERSGGPSLWDVFGRQMGSTEFEGYSHALSSNTSAWDEGSLREYLENPQSFAPGSTMPIPYFRSPEQLDAVVNYLRRLN